MRSEVDIHHKAVNGKSNTGAPSQHEDIELFDSLGDTKPAPVPASIIKPAAPQANSPDTTSHALSEANVELW